MRKRRQRIKRDAEQVSREVNLIELEEANFLSIVKRPANRIPFQIVRNEGGKVQRTRRDSALLSIRLPDETSDEDAAAIMRAYGLTEEEYEVSREEDQAWLKRKQRDADSEDPMIIQLANGMEAEIDKAAVTRSIVRSDDQPSLSVIKINLGKVTRSEAETWLKEKDIAFNKEDLFAVAGEQMLVRHDSPEDIDTVTVDLGEGKTAVAAHTQRDDIPHKIYRMVIEQAYGRSGWGHIDFFQAMLDEQFTADARSANHWLWEVLDNILFYSDLPLSDRQSLIENALGEYNAWITALMQSLPREIMSTNTVDLNSQGGDDTSVAASDSGSTTEDDGQEETVREDETETPTETMETAEMKQKQESGAVSEEAKRDDEVVTTTEDEQKAGAESEQEQAPVKTEREDAATEETKTDDEKISLSRSELSEIVSNAVTNALGSVEEKQRQEEELSDPTLKALGKVADAVEGLAKRMDSIEAAGSETVVRSDADDDGEAEGEEEDEDNARNEADPFRGSFLRADVLKRFEGVAKGK